MKKRDKSIKSKISHIAISTTVSALLLIFVVTTLANIAYTLKEVRAEITSIAEATAIHSSAAVLFSDTNVALETLSALDVIPTVLAAKISNTEGEVLAEQFFKTSRKDQQTLLHDLFNKPDSIFKLLHIEVPISVEQQVIGSVTIIADMNPMWSEIRGSIGIYVASMAMALLLVYLLVGRMSNSVIEPITKLNESAKSIARDKQYDHRVEKIADDELGRLVDQFNQMLAEIESRDTTLTTHNERLEYEVNNRTAHLQKAMQAANLANEAKTNFLSSMSHELRTPLNVIMGFSQLLMSDKDITDPSHQDSLKEIYTAGSHLLNLISDVLDFSKIESGTIELNIQPVSLYDLVDECIRLTSPTSEKYQVQVSIHPSISNDVVLSTDKLRLKQVLINLITNGIKYNHQNGRVTVACEITEHNQCAIKVIDTGIGIKADKLDQIFVAFERLGFESSAIEGTGIGLVLTKQLVELMDGHIHVSSREGEGSTFTISFSGDSLTS